MATGNQVRAGKSFVELTMRDKLSQGLKSAQRKLKAFGATLASVGKRLVAIGTVGVGLFLAAVKQFISFGDAIHKMSIRTGVAAASLSGLAHAAELSGADLDTLEKGLQRMARNIVDFSRGTGTGKRAFDQLGISFADVANLSPEDQFKLIAERLKAMRNPTLKTALAMDLFGRAGANLIPLLDEGAAGIDAMIQEAKDLGLIMSDEDAKAAAALGDAVTRVKNGVKGAALAIGGALTPALLKIAGQLKVGVVWLNKWVRENKRTVVIVATVFAGILALGGAILVVAGVVKIAAIGIGLLSGLLTVLSAIGSIATGVLSALGAVIAFLTSPIGLVIAAVVALGAIVLYVTGAAGKAMDWLKAKFAAIGKFFGATIKGMSDALASGNIALAANILWASLKLAWLQGTNAITGIWNDAVFGLASVLTSAWGGIQSVSESIWHGMSVGWLDTVGSFKTAWAAYKKYYLGTLFEMAGWAAKKWNEVRGYFDETFDVEASNAAVDGMVDEVTSQFDADLSSALDDLRTGPAGGEMSRHAQRMADIEAQTTGRQAALSEMRTEKERQAADELEAARSKWAELIGQAATESELDDSGDPLAPGLDALSEAGAGAAGASTRGTFNARAIQSLQTGGLEQRMLAAQERIAENTEALRDVDDLTFA